MKITKTQLRQIIAEELDNIQENEVETYGLEQLSGAGNLKARLKNQTVVDFMQELGTVIKDNTNQKSAKALGQLLHQIGLDVGAISTIGAAMRASEQEAAAAAAPTEEAPVSDG